MPIFCCCFEGIEDDEDLEEADIDIAINTIKERGGKPLQQII